MFIKLSSRVFPIVLLVLASLWMAGTIGPLIYSLIFPTRDIQRIVRALEGRETLPEDLAFLPQEITNAAGKLRRAIQVSAYWQVSADYRFKESHRIKETRLSYLAWFEKRPEPTILIVTRTEIDGSALRFDINEGKPISTIRAYLLPVLLLAFSVYWFRRKGSFRRDHVIARNISWGQHF